MASTTITMLVRVQYSLDGGTTWAISQSGSIDVPGETVPTGGPPTAVSATIGATSVTLSWADPVEGPPYQYLYGHTGGGEAAWEGSLPPTVHTATLDKLTPGMAYVVHVTAVAPLGAQYTATQSVTIPPAPSDPPPIVVTPSGTATIGAFVDHDLATAQGMAKWMGLAHLGSVCCFVTRATAKTVAAGEWMKSVPAGAELVLSVPLIPEDGTSLGTDLTTMFQAVARQAASIQANAVIRLAWEMNLPQWAWRVTDSNLSAWRAAWARAYDAMKTVAPHLRVGFNANGGGDQSGITGGITRAMVAGKVDWVGLDDYDAWPAMISVANIAEQLNRYGGLNWWAGLARSMRVPLWLPEVGVSSGTQWAGHCGGDNPAYITQLDAFRKKNADILGGICYFNEPKDYVRSDIYRVSGTPSNPKAAAEWRRLFGA